MSVQSDQVQYKSVVQLLLQRSASFADPGSQGFPQKLASFATDRCRYRWPPHWEQLPQSDHSPHSQSLHGSASQSWVLQVAVSASEPLQALPPCAAEPSWRRSRVAWPPPQSALHCSQSPHESSLQDSRLFLSQYEGTSSPVPGLQGVTSLRLVLAHGFPRPEGKDLTLRVRSFSPKHLPLQLDQELQSDTSQSDAGSHSVMFPPRPLTHKLYSSSAPTAGFPHEFGWRSTSRRRTLYAGRQVAEQLSQSAHVLQAPSTHFSQGFSWQTSTSDVAEALHGFPPACGGTLIWRLLCLVPFPHAVLQEDQGSQSAHEQSVGAHSCEEQFVNSSRGALHPVLPLEITLRLRRLLPRPHEAEQRDHSDHSDSWQVGKSHAPPHGRVSWAAPPSAKRHGVRSSVLAIWRLLSDWPPHSRLHLDQSDHSVISQGLGLLEEARPGQAIVSLREWLQLPASPSAGIRTLRLRNFW